MGPELETESQDLSAADDSAQQDVSDSSTTGGASQVDPQTGQPIEIDSLDRYRYKGQNLKDWESGFMRQQDYTQKTQHIAQERKYYDNLSYDLETVRSNPQLAEQFKSIYPEKFHGYLRYVLENSAGTPQQRPNGGNQASQYARLDPATEERIKRIESSYLEKEKAAITAELDSKFKTLSQKYPFADEESVVVRAQTLLSKMKEADPLNQNLKISDKQWDALWKAQHDRNHQLADAQYKKQVKSQVQANQKGSGGGKGGGIPGQAPRQFKTIKEATEQALADAEAGNI